MKVRFEFPDGRVAVIEGDEIGRVEVIGTADDLTASVCPRKPPRWSVLSIKPWAPLAESQPATPVDRPVSTAAPQHELEPLDSFEDHSPTVVS